MDEELEITPDTQIAPLTAINGTVLTPLVRSALKGTTLEVISWRGDPRQVRLGCTAGSLHDFLGTTAQVLSMSLDESLHGWFEEGFGHSVGECCDLWAQVGSFISRRIDEARVLIDVLG